jgi:hypothetical protein
MIPIKMIVNILARLIIFGGTLDQWNTRKGKLWRLVYKNYYSRSPTMHRDSRWRRCFLWNNVYHGIIGDNCLSWDREITKKITCASFIRSKVLNYIIIDLQHFKITPQCIALNTIDEQFMYLTHAHERKNSCISHTYLTHMQSPVIVLQED